jgi:hypothetical protein
MIAFKQHWDCEKILIDDFGMFSGEWYFFSITPIPDKNEIESVVYDIQNGHDILFLNKRLTHYENCPVIEHILTKEMKEIVQRVDRETFKVAVFNNTDKRLLGGQPIVIGYEPLITRSVFLNHPHLNGFGRSNQYGYIPSTFCYTDAPDSLGSVFGDRIIDTMFYVSDWLFRHQIWKASYKNSKEAIWIGNQKTVNRISSNSQLIFNISYHLREEIAFFRKLKSYDPFEDR